MKELNKDKFAKELGHNLRTARNRAGVTQGDLAEVMHMSRPYVSMTERGQYSKYPIDAYRLQLAADFLKVPLVALYPNPDYPDPEEELGIVATTDLGRRAVKALAPALTGLEGLSMVESSRVVEIHLAELPLSSLSALQAGCYQHGLDMAINGSGKALVLYVAEG